MNPEMPTAAPMQLLLAEDNDNDAEAFRLSLQRAHILNPVHVIGSGEEAVKYVRGEPPFEDREIYPVPGMIFLDIQLPGRSGLDVLRELKDDPEFAHIPAIILTVSQAEDDILQSYQYGSHVYIHKPVDPVNLRDVVLGLSGVGILLASQPA